MDGWMNVLYRLGVEPKWAAWKARHLTTTIIVPMAPLSYMILNSSTAVSIERVARLSLIHDAIRSDFEELQSNKFIKIVSFPCKKTTQPSFGAQLCEIAASNALIGHNFCFLAT